MAFNLINNLSLIEIIKHYFNYSDGDFIKQGKNLYATKCPLHKERKGTSFVIYDKTKENKGWDWVCFGSCNTGGNAANLLVDAGLFASIEEAVKDIRKVFKLEYPEEVTLENFAEFKGFDIDFLKSRGIDNHSHIKDGKIINGLAIPFYNTDKKVVAIKKRLKFEGSNKYIFVEGNNNIYGLDLINEYEPSILYIAEGETDALTLIQAGLQAIGVPGATAWKSCTEDKPDLFKKFEKIVIIPDQDKAGFKLVHSISSKFTENTYIINIPRKFNDVNEFFLYGCGGNKEHLYEYFTTQQLIPATPETFIIAAQENNKILSEYQAWHFIFSTLKNEVDILLFVDDLKNKLNINKNIITKAYSAAYKKYKNSVEITTEDDVNIFVRDRCYYKTVFSKDGGIVDIPISNFIIHLLYTIEADGNHVRVCKLENNKGQISKEIFFDAETLTKVNDFMSACKNAGNYIFKGDFKDLITLNELILKQEENIVHSPDHIGQVNNVWLMGRYGVDSKGQIVEADDNNIITLNDTNYMVRNINISDDADETFMPYKPDRIIDIDNDYLRDVAYTIKENIGGYKAWLALGFTVAGWHSTEIYNHQGDKSFPIFFISGKRNSGKTYLARWLMSAYGFPHIEGKNFAMPSIVSMTRKLGYYSSLPQWYDDYKNDIKDIKFRDEFLLGVYNRQGADKGTKTGFGVRAERIRGFLLLSGEDTPDDNAVFSRCCIIHVSAYDRNDDKLNHMLDLVKDFPSMGLHFLIKKQKNGSAKLLNYINNIKETLMKEGIDGRLAKNIAVFAGSFLSEFEDVIDNRDRIDFINWLIKQAHETKDVTENDHTVSRFFSDLTVLMLDGKIQNGKHYKVKDNLLYLWFKGCYDVWKENYKPDIKRTVLLDYIVKEPFFVSKDERIRLGVNQSQIRCLVLDYTKVLDDDFKAICASSDDSEAEF